MRERIKTIPNLADSSPAHQAAKAAGNDHFRAWEHNVIDSMKGNTEDEIREHLRTTANPFAVCFEHWISDFNMASGIRNANAFNAKEVFYIGDKKWDKRAAVGVYNYTEVQWLPTVEELNKLHDKYIFVGIDNVPGSITISNYNWPSNALMVFGEEGVGLTPAMQAMCNDIVEIPMFGSVRSLNCGVASGIVMYDYMKYWGKHGRQTKI